MLWLFTNYSLVSFFTYREYYFCSPALIIRLRIVYVINLPNFVTFVPLVKLVRKFITITIVITIHVIARVIIKTNYLLMIANKIITRIGHASLDYV